MAGFPFLELEYEQVSTLRQHGVPTNRPSDSGEITRSNCHISLTIELISNRLTAYASTDTETPEYLSNLIWKKPSMFSMDKRVDNFFKVDFYENF